MPKAFFSIASEEIIIDFSFHFFFEIESIILKLLKLKQYHHAYTNALYNMLSTKFRKELFGLVTPGIRAMRTPDEELWTDPLVTFQMGGNNVCKSRYEQRVVVGSCCTPHVLYVKLKQKK